MATDSATPSVTFLTRHYPPNPNINGESVWDLVGYFKEHYGINSNIITTDRGFEGGGQDRLPRGKVYRIRTLYQGKSAVLRLITFFYDGYMLARRALRFPTTLVVCTTSPPLLPMWASLFYRGKTRWALWSFDLFPEGFRASGEVSGKNPLYRLSKKLTYRRAPSLLIALGPRQAAYIQRSYNKEIPCCILPCGVLFYQERSEAVPPWRREAKIYLGYCGNLGDPHDPDFLKAVIDHLDPEKQVLVLALYGNKADIVKEYAKGRKSVILVDRVPRDQLHFIDVHLVSLLTTWTHIAVPSKAVSAVSLGCPILFCGSADSDNWFMLQKAGWLIPEGTEMSNHVARFLKDITSGEIEGKKRQANLLAAELRTLFLESYNAIADHIR
jgi:hypothetical protein